MKSINQINLLDKQSWLFGRLTINSNNEVIARARNKREPKILCLSRDNVSFPSLHEKMFCRYTDNDGVDRRPLVTRKSAALRGKKDSPLMLHENDGNFVPFALN